MLMGDSASRLVTWSKLGTAVKEQPYQLTIPGRMKGGEASYFPLVTWHPNFLLRGSAEKRPGSQYDVFTRCFALASDILYTLNELTGGDDESA